MLLSMLVLSWWWWLHVNSSFCSHKYSMWVVHSGILVTVIVLIIPSPFFHCILALIGCKLCILACWWLWSCWWLHVHSSSCCHNHRLWVVYSDILVTLIMLIIDINCMSILYPVLSIIDSELCILPYWWMYLCWWFQFLHPTLAI